MTPHAITARLRTSALILALATCANCARTRQVAEGTETEFRSIDDAMAYVRTNTGLPPIFIVDGELVDSISAERRSRVKTVAVSLEGGAQCRPQFAINGVCRPLILATLRPVP